MTNLEGLRLLETEQMAEFLTDQRMAGLRTVLEKYEYPVAPVECQIREMFQAWLLAECEL